MAPAPTTTTSGLLIAARCLLLDTTRRGDYTICERCSHIISCRDDISVKEEPAMSIRVNRHGRRAACATALAIASILATGCGSDGSGGGGTGALGEALRHHPAGRPQGRGRVLHALHGAARGQARRPRQRHHRRRRQEARPEGRARAHGLQRDARRRAVAARRHHRGRRRLVGGAPAAGPVHRPAVLLPAGHGRAVGQAPTRRSTTSRACAWGRSPATCGSSRSRRCRAPSSAPTRTPTASSTIWAPGRLDVGFLDPLLLIYQPEAAPRPEDPDAVPHAAHRSGRSSSTPTTSIFRPT